MRKGFTLIELLVVVAIIGILAAVGVVAYNGYTNSAKIAATKSQHKTIVKFMQSEIMKCSLGNSNLELKSSNGSKTSVSCDVSSINTITLGSRFVDHFKGDGFKNPFNNPDNNSSLYSTTGNSPVLGQTRIVNAGGNKIQIVTKFDGSTGQWAGNQNEVLITEILMKDNIAFTLIELLVVVAIIGILAAVGVVAYNGYTSSAKAANTQSNHKLVSSYIQNQLKKCELGNANIMQNQNYSLSCNNIGSASVINYLAASSNSPFSDLKNIYNLNSNQQYLTKGIREHSTWVQNLNWQNSDIGTVWLAPKSNQEIHVRTCFRLPCSTSSNRLETLVYIE